MLSLLRSFPDQFNESTMFPGGKEASVELRKQFQVILLWQITKTNTPLSK